MLQEPPPFSFANKILDRLFLGSVEASQTFAFIEQNQISVIMNCSKDIDNKYQLNLIKPIEEAPKEVQDWLYNNSFYVKYYRIPVDDNSRTSEIDNFYNYLTTEVDKIIAEFEKGKTILVHCLAGNQRSAAFVAAFLMKYKNIRLKEAIEFVQERKPNVFLFGRKVNFMDALLKYEKDIFS